ncbi:MAG TPA: ABC transporter substrate-binding protein [Actinocrinis sp.]|nr:ABC transporter substrate-binding protein [Actinocrinis sp.]
MSPQSPRVYQGPTVDRRIMLKGLLGAAGVAALPTLAACSSSSKASSSSSSGAASGTVSLGSNASDAVPKKAFQAVYDAFQAKNPSIKVQVNTKDHDTFQEQINSYLQATPDDVFTWFAGYRMQFFAAKGLSNQIDDVWNTIGNNFPQSVHDLSKGQDGHYYFVPIYYYPWAVFYRKSVFAAHNYTVPTDWNGFVSLCEKMKSDGLNPIAFADADKWPAMGTFDQLNMRTNGYQFHMDLMHGKAAWTDAKVKKAFDYWTQILPYHQAGYIGRKWQDAAQSLLQKKSGMYLLGTFVAQQFTNPDDLADLDFFAFPAIDSQWGQDSIEAPVDGFMLSKSPKNRAAAAKLLEFIGSADGEGAYLKVDNSYDALVNGYDTSGYNAIQKKSAQLFASAQHVSQFMDRDANPAFTSTVMQPQLQAYLQNPGSISSILSSIEQQKQSIYNS